MVVENELESLLSHKENAKGRSNFHSSSSSINDMQAINFQLFIMTKKYSADLIPEIFSHNQFLIQPIQKPLLTRQGHLTVYIQNNFYKSTFKWKFLGEKELKAEKHLHTKPWARCLVRDFI